MARRGELLASVAADIAGATGHQNVGHIA
jgi:hypothetical protein